jgi:hypothetical protein
VVTNRRRGTNRFVLAFFDGDCVWQPMERIGQPIYRNCFTICICMDQLLTRPSPSVVVSCPWLVSKNRLRQWVGRFLWPDHRTDPMIALFFWWMRRNKVDKCVSFPTDAGYIFATSSTEDLISNELCSIAHSTQSIFHFQ